MGEIPPLRKSPSILATVLALNLSSGSVARPDGGASCIDYGDYIHRVNTLETPGWAVDVVVSGGHAYVADASTELLVVDLASPELPVIVGSADVPGSSDRCIPSTG